MDLQRDFLDAEAGRMPVAAADASAVLKVANEVLSKDILAGALPILVVNAFPATARIGNFFRRGAAVAGTAGAEIDERVRRSGSEVTIAKATASAFSNPALAACLRANGIREIYVLGVYAEGCVRATVIDAIKSGYRVHVIASAVATNAIWKKRFALWSMKRAGAKIWSCVEVLTQRAPTNAPANR
jgi:nicotinamidase-related amidase